MSNLIIPIMVMGILIYGMAKKIDLYEAFITGVKEGLNMALKIFPTLFAMVISIDVFIKSNLINDLASFLSPLLNFLQFPQELLPLAIMRPLSGSSSLVLMNDILKTYGPDSFLGRVASILQGSTDTTIYILGLYFSSVGVKKIKYSLIVGLLADVMAIILSIVVVRILF